jgi:hypothetical protein
MATPVTVNEVLDGQVALDLRCLDRIYLNAYVPNLQVGGQVVSFFDRALGPSRRCSQQPDLVPPRSGWPGCRPPETWAYRQAAGRRVCSST